MIRWRGDKFLADVRDDLAKRFVKAGVYFVSKTRGYLNVAQPYRRTESGGHVGLSPSAPGQFPKKLSGQLMRSVTWNFGRSKMELTVGSNLKGYPKYLQTSTRFMAARPWLSLSWDREQTALGQIITG